MDIENVITMKEAVPAEGDYRNEDGLLVCGCCGNRKEKKITLLGRTRIVRCLCQCDEWDLLRQKQIDEETQKRERVNRLKTSSMMDVRYNGARFDRFKVSPDNEKIYNLCKHYVEDYDKFILENKGIILWGDVGTGKSYAAACIANELMGKGYPVIMTSFVKALELIRRGSDEEEEFMKTIQSAKLVIFDDLGSERNTDFALEKVFNIVDTRYRSGLPMIFTTNLKFRDMLNEKDIRYKRVYDRIFEVCYPVEVKGASWRKKKASELFKEEEEWFT